MVGVGALSLNCARKGVKVIANDLNPEAFLALKHNTEVNGLQMKVLQEDARDLLDELFQVSSTQGHSQLYADLGLPRGSSIRQAAVDGGDALQSGSDGTSA